MGQNDIVNDFLKSYTELRTTLHRIVYSEENIIDDISESIQEKFGDDIINLNCIYEEQVLSFSCKRTENDGVKLTDFTSIINPKILDLLIKYKDEIIDYNTDNEELLTKICDGSLSVSQLYNIVAFSTEKRFDLTLTL